MKHSLKTMSKIVGDRIFLKTLHGEPISKEYAAWMQDPDILQYLTAQNKAYSAAELEQYVARMEESGRDWLFGIFLKGENKHVGNIKIGNVNSLHRFGDIGLIIGDKNIWGKGYGTEAIYLTTQYAFDELSLNKLTAGMMSNNPGSLRAFIKAGYREVGQLKNHVLFHENFVDVVLVEKCNECTPK